MYIKLGKTRINYLTPSTNDTTILSEIIKSSIQYQNPVYVRNLDELNIWFGQDFKEYSYFSELLSQNATLYLTGPLREDRLVNEEAGEVDYYSWPIKEVDKLPIEPEPGEEKYRYVIKGTSSTYIWYRIDKDTYTFVDVTELPQELQPFKSKSLENRDTLVIWNDGTYVSPSYGKHTLPEGYLNSVDLSGLNSNDLKNGKTSLAFKFAAAEEEYVLEMNKSSAISSPLGEKLQVKLLSNTSWEIKEEDCMINVSKSNIISSADGEILQIKLMSDAEWGIKENDTVIEVDQSEVISNSSGEKLQIKLTSNASWEIREREQDKYIVFGVNCYYWGSKPELGEDYVYHEQLQSTLLEDVLRDEEDFIISNSIAYSKTIRTATYFSNNITFTPLYTESSNVVYEKLKDRPHVEVVSKTLGTDELNPIEVSYSTDSDELSVSRFGYSEYYFPQEGIDFYDDISNNSKLITCEKIKDFEWTSGYWEMCGAVQEDIHNLSTSLEVLTSDDVQADFLFIDSYTDYLNITTEDGVKSLLSGVLKKWPNTQILVQNSSNDFSYNYLENSNKVIYSFGSMKLNGEYRPGWYVFLGGLLNNDFSFKTSNIVYPDLIQDKIDEWVRNGYTLEIRKFIEKWYVKDEEEISYDVELEERKKKLEEYKSNYLTSADYYNFYERLFDGDKYESSGLMRFVIDKVNREINKNFEGFIGEQDYSKQRDLLILTLRKVSTSYDIINGIYINNFKIDKRHNSLKTTVQIEISDLEKNDIITDIELNYSK